MKPHEIIYLQNPDEDELEFWDETTWCSDKINENDAKYMLASPLLLAASDLLEQLKETHAALCFTAGYLGSVRCIANSAAIAKAESKA